jgi:hypothetical protein
MIMSTMLCSALVAIALLSSVSAAWARVKANDTAGPYSRAGANAPESVKSFWKNQQRYGH